MADVKNIEEFENEYALITLVDDEGNDIIIVCNFVPVERRDYKIGVPQKGRYKLVFNTDAAEFGGTGVTEKSFKTSHYAMHGFEESISMTLAPLSVIYLKFAPVKKRAPKASDEEKVSAEKKTSAEEKVSTEKKTAAKKPAAKKTASGRKRTAKKAEET